MTGKTEDHKDYKLYNCLTKKALIRKLINEQEKCLEYYNRWSKLSDEHHLCVSKKNVEISYLMDDINMLKDMYKDVVDKYMGNSKKTKKKKKTYLIKNNINGFYKIGRSSNPKKREKTLQSEEPNILIVKTWDKDIEGILHKDYKDFRLRGEWFKLSKIQVKYICTHY